MEKYEKLEVVGEGTYGKVYKGRDKLTGRMVALKKTRFVEDGVPPTAIREISLLRSLSHCIYVVKLLDVDASFTGSGKPVLFMVFEYANCDLRQYIDKCRRSETKLTVKSIQSFMYQLCKGITYCHSHGVLHRDLKPQNILVDQRVGLLKIADLGLGRSFTVPIKNYTQEVVTLWYRAPEVLLGTKHYSTAIDVWSLGCIFAELCNMKVLFNGDSQIQQLLKIFRLIGTPNEQLWPGVTQLNHWHEFPQWKPQDFSKIVSNLDSNGLDLISRMLQHDPARRISAKAALHHPYFDSLDRSQF
ncbi:hypothetical protein SUGI_0107790 [Cryptomeria japonica]|uniref:cyclin-dependent kinase B1-1 n=1 Tax=Cryptomeria japonica TaxID=3369 RepID=UPI002408D620|nr:cyclin-dependent kinase B1-1 [Cryptomeria japonica]GLJ09380.1 hypothetical protein SUGI_0107790 [Cryptomeria japonica]